MSRRPPQLPSDPHVAMYLPTRGSWSPHHITVATSVLNMWSAWLAEQGVTSVCDATGAHCAAYLRGRLEDGRSTSTVHKDYQHLMWLYMWLVADGWVLPSDEVVGGRRRKVHATVGVHALGPMAGITPPKVTEAPPERVQACDVDTYERLMSSFRPSSLLDCRNAAVCSLMFRSGLRRSEVCRADFHRLDLGARPCVSVLGKNDQYRSVPIARETATWLARYVQRLKLAGHDTTRGPLFVKSYNGTAESAAGDMRLSPNAIREMLDRRTKRLGIHITSHMFRRGFAIESKRNGVSDSAVITVAGWSDPRQLKRYTKSQRESLAADELYAADPTGTPDGALRRGGTGGKRRRPHAARRAEVADLETRRRRSA